MWQRLSLYDMRVIGHYLGMLSLFFTVGLAVPFVTALIFGETEPASRYLLAMGITLFVGSLLRFLRVRPGRLTRRQALIVTGLSWILFALYAAVPLSMATGQYANFGDALFEGVSGLTTTGASTVIDLDHLSYADNMWRFMMHLIGGMGLVVVGMTFGLFGKGAGASLFAAEGRSEHVVPNVVESTKFIARIAAVFILLSTVIVSAVCMVLGIDPVRAVLQALWMSLSAFMTAGFVPMSENIAYYHSFVLECVLIIVMLTGTVNFALHYEIVRGRPSNFFRDMETRMGGAWLVIMVIVLTASLALATKAGQQAFSDLPTLLRRGLFMVVAAFSTTGFQNISSEQLVGTLSSGAFLVLAILMAFGSTSGSTVGGIKLSRMVMAVKSVVYTVKNTIAPDSARVTVSYYHMGKHTVTPSLLNEALTVTALYATTYVIGALVGIAHGCDATSAIFESIAMASNGGLSAGIVSPDMPLTLEAFYIFEMWAGRLEFITLLALFAQIGVSLVPHSLSDWWHRRAAARSDQ